MRFCIVFLLLSLVTSWRTDSNSDEGTSEEDLDYIRHVSTTMDFRGDVRKRFALELGLSARGKNRICSPLSAMLPLAKLLLGASKATKQELLYAVGLDRRNELKAVIGQMIKELEYLDGVEVSIASRIFVSDTKTLRSKFARRTKKIFGSTLGQVDMTRPRTVANDINSWVYEKTRRKIKDIISPDDINSHISLIIVNAIYFRGTWQYPFHGAYKDTFYSTYSSGKCFMMRRTGQYKYYASHEMNAQVYYHCGDEGTYSMLSTLPRPFGEYRRFTEKIIEIPYTGQQAALIIVLPNKRDGLSILLRTLQISPDMMKSALINMKTTTVDLTIPKFKIETTLNLNDYYYKMGIKRVISRQQSQLTDVVRDETVYISKSIQKAFIEVTEKGTVAAAATAGLVHVMQITGMKRFTADHPFLFYIRANREQLFAGVVYSP